MAAVQEVDPGVNPIVEELGGATEFQRLWGEAQDDNVLREVGKPKNETLLKSYLGEGFPEDLVQLLQNIEKNTRDLGHLTRLLNGGKDEYELAVVLLKRSKFLQAELYGNNSEFRKVYRGEDADTVMWYTLAPSLLSLLREKGITDQDSLMILMNWTATKSRKYDDYPTLDGLKELKPYIPTYEAIRSFVLGKKPDGPSHVFARTLSTQLLKHGSFFQKQLQALNTSSSQAAT